MPNRLVYYAQDKQDEALSFQAWQNAEGQNPFFPGTYAYCNPCKYQGQPGWVVPYLGPPEVCNGVPIEEPEGREEARASGIIVDAVEPPDEEE